MQSQVFELYAPSFSLFAFPCTLRAHLYLLLG
nr:MAG TPA: Protein of unknown function (DUF1201) [Caudoviricetes sp.]